MTSKKSMIPARGGSIAINHFQDLLDAFAFAGQAGKIVYVNATATALEARDLPPLAITDVFVVGSEIAMLALTAQRGDVAVRTDIEKSFILQAEPATVLANWIELLFHDAVLSVNGKVNTVVLTYSDVGAAAASHAAQHNAGGGDAMAIDAAAATGSLRTIGTGALQAAAGNDARLSDARTPTAHASTHNAGGGDAMAIDAAAATGSLRTIGTGALQAAAGNDARLSNSRTPTAHASTHNAGGGDAMAIDAAAATGSLRTIGTGALQAAAGNDARLSTIVAVKTTITHTQLQAAALSNSITLLTLPAGAIVIGTRLKVNTVFSGGAIANYFLSLGQVGTEQDLMTEYDAKNITPGAQEYAEAQSFQSFDYDNTVALKITARSVGANLSASSQGTCDVAVFYLSKV